jgi:hypothetical protein
MSGSAYPRERREGSELVRHPLTPSAACRWKRTRQRGPSGDQKGKRRVLVEHIKSSRVMAE